ncbi:MAG: hypothetical protein L6Q55_01020 [Azonexus sp.]|nr:hypothetical protein [Azonexus sp.]MCK6410990.1 hypothetical protein [Azonexus sp.]
MRGLIFMAMLALALATQAAPAKKAARSRPVGGIAYTQPRPVVSCACVDGAYCVGPRGGRFCINGSGRKRYF